MRIKLSDEAEKAYEDVLRQLAEANPFVQVDKSKVIGGLIVIGHRAIEARDLEALAQELSTPESRRLALVRQVERLSATLDAEGLKTLEATFKKATSQVKKLEEAKHETSKQSA